MQKVKIKRKLMDRDNGKKHKALGVYIFAGGFSVGVAKHFDVVAHLEDGPFGVATARENFPGLEVRDDPAKWNAEEFKGVDFLYANPPCAPWSMANFGGNNWKDDPRISCFTHVVECIKKARPKVAVIESVRGAFTRGREMMDRLAAEVAPLGYACDHLLTDACNHGVPQERKRYFLVLRQVEVDWKQPETPPVTAGQALNGIKDPGRGEKATDMHIKLLKHAKPGERLAKVFNRLFPDRIRKAEEAKAETLDKIDRHQDFAAFKRASWENRVVGRPSFLKMVVHPDKFAPAVTGGAHLFHWKDRRMLSVLETQVLCSYPRDFNFVGSIHDAHAQIGKAVMPNVGEWIARQALAAVKANRKAKAGSSRIVTVHADRVEVASAQEGGPGLFDRVVDEENIAIVKKPRLVRRKA